MSEFELSAEPRIEHGKGAMRRMRREGKVPAIIYGAGKEPKSLVLVTKDVTKSLENEAFSSHILEVTSEGETEQVVLKAVQRHPATSQVLHVDLQRVSATQALHMNVPLHFDNEEEAPGKKAGGMVSRHIIEVEVSCLPKDLPEFIAVDMGEMEIGDTIHLSELVVPEGVQLLALLHAGEATMDPAVVSVTVAKIIEDIEEEDEEGEEGLELAEGEEAPAAEGDASSEETSEDDKD